MNRTDTANALAYLRTTMFATSSPEVSRIAILLSVATSINVATTLREADLMRRAGIQIMSVVIGSWLDINEQRAIVSYPADRNMLWIQNYNALNFSLVKSAWGSVWAGNCCLCVVCCE